MNNSAAVKYIYIHETTKIKKPKNRTFASSYWSYTPFETIYPQIYRSRALYNFRLVVPRFEVHINKITWYFFFLLCGPFYSIVCLKSIYVTACKRIQFFMVMCPFYKKRQQFIWPCYRWGKFRLFPLLWTFSPGCVFVGLSTHFRRWNCCIVDLTFIQL